MQNIEYQSKISELSENSKNFWLTKIPKNHLAILEEIVILQFSHYNFLGDVQVGEVAVNRAIVNLADDVFKAIFTIKFPIFSAKLIENFDGDDLLSMEANNSSSFNFRLKQGLNELSKHATGMAIDINPAQNPFFDPETDECLPSNSRRFLCRNLNEKGMVEEIVPIFEKNGFTWLGKRKSKPDYHHFEI